MSLKYKLRMLPKASLTLIILRDHIRWLERKKKRKGKRKTKFLFDLIA